MANLQIVTRAKACHLISAPCVVAVLSIGSPCEPPPPRLYERRRWVRLEFDDVPVESCGQILRGRPAIPPCQSDIHTIVEFGRSTADLTGDVIVHCGDGLVRSAAAGAIILAMWDRTLTRGKAVEAVQRLRPLCKPHSGMLDMAYHIWASPSGT